MSVKLDLSNVPNSTIGVACEFKEVIEAQGSGFQRNVGEFRVLQFCSF